MTSLPRFQPPTRSDEYHPCGCCGEMFYYTELDKRGVCEGCREEGDEDDCD